LKERRFDRVTEPEPAKERLFNIEMEAFFFGSFALLGQNL